MLTNKFTSIINESTEKSAAALQAFNPKRFIWIEFNQPIRCLKASAAVECIFQSIASECENSLEIQIEGLAVIYGGEDVDRLASDSRIALFLSWPDRGKDRRPYYPWLTDVVDKICNRLRSCGDSDVFASLNCSEVIPAEGISNVIEVYGPTRILEQGIVLTPLHFRELRRICTHEAGHTAIARHYGSSSRWSLSPVATIYSDGFISWEGTANFSRNGVSRSQQIRIGLAGIVAACLLDDPCAEANQINDDIYSGIIELSATDEAVSEGYRIRDIGDTLKLVRKHMPAILRDADYYVRAFEETDGVEVAA